MKPRRFHLRISLALPAVFSLLILIGCDGSEAPSPDNAAQEEQVDKALVPIQSVDGAALFLEHCAGCHGKTGDGKGSTKLPQPARNFRAGGFAFGNTEEALFKMVTSGMPGRNPMPSFADILTKDERRSVVKHVLTLVPQKERKPARDRVLQVKSETLIARGLLPSMAKGAPSWPRGLLIGLPSGWTLAYSTENTRLLGGFLGAFCDRTDWDQRGGGALKPMGRLMFLMGGGNPKPSWWTVKDRKPIEVRFRASFASGEQGGIEYTLQLPTGPITVRETCEFIQTSVGSGIKRTFELPPLREEIDLAHLLKNGRARQFKSSQSPAWTQEDAPGAFTCLMTGSDGNSVGEIVENTLAEGGKSAALRVSASGNRQTVWLVRAFLKTDSAETVNTFYSEMGR